MGCGGNSGTGAGLSRPLRFFLANYHPTNVLAVIYHWGLVNLARLRLRGCSTKAISLALPPTAKELNDTIFIENLTVTDLVKTFSASRDKQKFQDHVHKILPQNHIPSQFNPTNAITSYLFNKWYILSSTKSPK